MHFIIPDLYSVEYLMENLEMDENQNVVSIRGMRIKKSSLFSYPKKLKKKKMFLVTDERLKFYPPPIQILMIAMALALLVVFFYYSFWDSFYKIVFTDEPRVGSDYAGFALAIAIIIVIIETILRLLKHTAGELKKKLR